MRKVRIRGATEASACVKLVKCKLARKQIKPGSAALTGKLFSRCKQMSRIRVSFGLIVQTLFQLGRI